MIIGLTGGIASGKSTVSAYLEELGAVIIDSDKIAHDVIKKDRPAYKKIVNKFASNILNTNGDINRSRLASIIFSSNDKKKVLEEITHPYIIKNIFNKIEEYRESNRIIILDAPLLFEVGLDRVVDQTWLVYLDRETQIKRLVSRDKISTKEAVNRIDAQLSMEEKKRIADYVLDNRGSIGDLKVKTLKKWREINES